MSPYWFDLLISFAVTSIIEQNTNLQEELHSIRHQPAQSTALRVSVQKCARENDWEGEKGYLGVCWGTLAFPSKTTTKEKKKKRDLPAALLRVPEPCHSPVWAGLAVAADSHQQPFPQWQRVSCVPVSPSFFLSPPGDASESSGVQSQLGPQSPRIKRDDCSPAPRYLSHRLQLSYSPQMRTNCWRAATPKTARVADLSEGSYVRP